MNEKKKTSGVLDTLTSVIKGEKGQRHFNLMMTVSLALCVGCMLLAFVLAVFFDGAGAKFFALGALFLCLPIVFLSFWSHKTAKKGDKNGLEATMTRVTGKLIRKSEETYGFRNIEDPESHRVPDYKSREYRKRAWERKKRK